MEKRNLSDGAKKVLANIAVSTGKDDATTSYLTAKIYLNTLIESQIAPAYVIDQAMKDLSIARENLIKYLYN